ncbi:transposase ISH9 [Halobacterium sp. DL1]|nr:transposase ISH9 [Halobacterium sp. DL1]AHG03043.1 transposase ISH9 [Halobacterium sp. DL1]AHG04715.1 transposase ISH9 [Halobacterium sp. DL1]
MVSEFRLLTRVTVAKAKSVVATPDEPADPEGGRGFAEWAMLTLHALRIELGKSYRVAVDLLSEMPGVLEEIGLTRLPHYTVLRTWFARIPTKTWRAFLDASVEERTGHAAIDSTGFDRDQPSRHYANRTNYRVRALKVTALVDVETLYITDIHSTTSKKHDAKIGPQVARRNAGDLRSLAADRGYDAKAFRDELRENGIRPLIKHRIMNPLDHAHNARMDGDRYHQRSMSETVFSSIKRTLGAAVRARSWWLEFREMLLKATVYNLRRSVRYP